MRFSESSNSHFSFYSFFRFYREVTFDEHAPNRHGQVFLRRLHTVLASKNLFSNIANDQIDSFIRKQSSSVYSIVYAMRMHTRTIQGASDNSGLS